RGGPDEVDVDDAAQLIPTELQQRLVEQDARIGEQNVDPAGSLGERFDRDKVRLIVDDRVRVGTKLRRGVLQSLRIPVREHQPGPELAETPRRCEANTARSAGNADPLAREV